MYLLQKESELVTALGQGYILYGEWLQITHTVLYDALPDWFIAFDLYDIQSARFLSTQAR